MNLRRLMIKPEVPVLERPWNFEWEMKDRTVVLSHDMSNNHIHNCIKMLDNKILILRLKALEGHGLSVRMIQSEIKEWHLCILQFKKEIAWRNENSTYISKTKIRKDIKF